MIKGVGVVFPKGLGNAALYSAWNVYTKQLKKNFVWLVILLKTHSSNGVEYLTWYRRNVKISVQDLTLAVSFELLGLKKKSIRNFSSLNGGKTGLKLF